MAALARATDSRRGDDRARLALEHELLAAHAAVLVVLIEVDAEAFKVLRENGFIIDSDENYSQQCPPAHACLPLEQEGMYTYRHLNGRACIHVMPAT